MEEAAAWLLVLGITVGIVFLLTVGGFAAVGGGF